MNSFNKYIKIILDLSKIRITSFVAISASVGYIFAAGKLSFEMLLPIVAVLFLSSGLSALNQFQEHKTDRLMKRTYKRPIPFRTINPETGLGLSLVLTFIGLLLLAIIGNSIIILLGIFSIIWYNFFYTPLKRKTALAVIPGAFVGTIAPTIGYLSAGGNLFDLQLWALNLFIFIWQVPHFWLLLIIYEQDYKNAGFPTLSDLFAHRKQSKITFVWIFAMALSCFIIPITGAVNNPVTLIALIVAGLWLLWRTKSLLGDNNQQSGFSFAFKLLNFYVLIIVIILSIDKLV